MTKKENIKTDKRKNNDEKQISENDEDINKKNNNNKVEVKEKSIKVNAIINSIKVLLSIIFPIITFPYASRILGADNIGKVQFASSIIEYLSLIAALGITTYATREGAIIRNDKEKLQKFANQVFTINMITTAISYFIMVVMLLLPTKLVNYRYLILIQSMSILFTTIGVDWIYNIYEDYAYITKKSIITHIISMVLLFLFVKQSEDYYIYALISVIANVSVNIFNFIHARKYCKLKLTKHINLKRHIKSMIILFSNTLAIKIYVNSDVILLGMMTSDFTVGLYTVSVKVYTIIKHVINAITSVTLPRMSLYANKDKEKYEYLLEKLLKTILTLIIPAVCGIIILSRQIILLIAGSEYIEGAMSLTILSIALAFSTLGNILISGILIPNKQEKYAFKSTLIAAIFNILLNFIAIPLWQQNGAALTTVIAEFIVCVVCLYYSVRIYKFRNLKKTIFISLISCIAIVGVSEVVKLFVQENTLQTLLICAGGVISYGIVSILLRNEVIIEILMQLKNKVLGKLKKAEQKD